MTTRVGRTVRLSALALATGTVVVAASTGASAAPKIDPAFSYAGTTGSANIGLAVNLPGSSAVTTPLGTAFTSAGLTSPFTASGGLNLAVLQETGQLLHDASGKAAPVATSQGTLLGGSLGDLLTSLQKMSNGSLTLNQTVVSSLANPGTHTSSQALGQLTANEPAQLAGLLALTAPGISETTVTSPTSTSGTSKVASLDIGKLADLFPAGTLDQLEAALTAAQTQVTSTISTINSALGSGGSMLLGNLPPNQLTTALKGGLTQLQTLLTELNGEIPKAISSLVDGSIVSLTGLSTTHSVNTSGGEQVSTVSNKLAGLSILGGLVTLDGFSNSLTTQAGGTAGTAKVIAQPNLAKATVGTNNELTATIGQITTVSGTIADLISQQGALGSVLGPINTGLTSLSDALATAFGAAGIHVYLDKVTKNEVAKDGTSAKAALAGLEVVFAPPSGLPSSFPTTVPGIGSLARPRATSAATTATPAPTSSASAAAAPVLDIHIGGANAASVVAVPATAVAPAIPTRPSSGQLAFTGADLPLTAGVATLLVIGGAYAVRRRRSAVGSDDV